MLDLEAQAGREGRVRPAPRASRSCVPGSWRGRSAGPWHREGWPSAQSSGSGRDARSSADSPRGRAGLHGPRCRGEAQETVPRVGWSHFSRCPGQASGEGLHSFLQPALQKNWLDGGAKGGVSGAGQASS